MSTYGLELRDENGVVTFDLTTRMTNFVWSKRVSADASGHAYVHVPTHVWPVVHAVPLAGDGYVRHVPHRVTFNADTGYLTWEPGLTAVDSDNVSEFEPVGRPVRSASRIHVIGYVTDE